MKIRSQLSSIVICALLIGVIVICLYFATKSGHDPKIITSYHQSQWNDYAPEMDRAVRKLDSAPVKGLNMSHVYGGIVSHHIPTTIPKLVEFYTGLKVKQNVKNFIIIGPDHTDAGIGPISVSAASFITKYGQLQPINDLAVDLERKGTATIDEKPFDPEHSIGSQVLVISKIFPDAHIMPIILRSDTSSAHAQRLGKDLADAIDEDTVLIASVDFSHYLSTDRAMPIDQTSGQIIRDLDLNSISLVKADSNKSIEAFIVAMKAKNAINTEDVEIINTGSFMQNSDYTTGYVFGYWGR